MSVHLKEDELILLHYGESEDAEGGRRHLDTCSNCATEFEELAIQGNTVLLLTTMPHAL